MFDSVYSDTRVLVTGHTGFKGSWLCMWLEGLGASVTGYALPPPTQPNHFDDIGLKTTSIIGDILDYNKLLVTLNESSPEVVFHLAAQPSVLYSYNNPIETFRTNVMGAAHLLEACRHTPSVRAVVIVTTDKCYENKEWVYGYRENDELGGYDPYSSSKACVELVTASYRQSFFELKDLQETTPTLIASARAGNVIGGGDWTNDRLIPDAARAAAEHRPVSIRNPASSRPWQHVLEPLSGYLLLGQRLLEGHTEFAEAWNFGPTLESNLATKSIINLMHRYWPAVSGEFARRDSAPHEAGLLMLDSTKARQLLGWKPVWGVEETIEKTADWYRTYIDDHRVITENQIADYIKDAVSAGSIWAS